ncbi:MAG: type II toxin-antitoxin system VapC family toxin [Thermoanaerobaculia bacterium]
MILVDTSAWIEVLRGRGLRYREVVGDEQVVTCLPVLQEILQGIHDERSYRATLAGFAEIPIIENPCTADVFNDAIHIYRAARRAGRTIRSSTDCLIAAVALRNNATILHCDRDFTHLGRVSKLKTLEL